MEGVAFLLTCPSIYLNTSRPLRSVIEPKEVTFIKGCLAVHQTFSTLKLKSSPRSKISDTCACASLSLSLG